MLAWRTCSMCWRFKEANLCFWKFCWKSIFYFNVLNAKCQSWFLAGLNQLIWSVEGSIQSVGSFMLAWFTWIACWRFKEANLCFCKFCWKRIFYFNVSNYYVMCKKTSRSVVLSVSKTWGEKCREFFNLKIHNWEFFEWLQNLWCRSTLFLALISRFGVILVNKIGCKV